MAVKERRRVGSCRERVAWRRAWEGSTPSSVRKRVVGVAG
jgi:hypothetical protein